ncbi:Tat pathway signal protein [Streptomyces sp. SID10362]|uniref:Tat pathway signal protein n=1 Tax=Streptomyces sp. SID10362 TaxID=2706021 RepID=UPI0013C81F24|nr:Tat pathway signal protein [Streptomyces sp. SID10362]NDZ73731.1 Tat pathway signal protein [Streptomyces sp. SID10362]
MIRTQVRRRGTGAALLAAAMLGGATPVVLPAAEAEAAPLGRVCLFQDKERVRGAGHVAWSIRDPKNSSHWIWGSTEGRGNDTYIPAGSANGSWIKGGTWTQLRSSISTASYDYYRCINPASGNLKAAQQTYGRMKTNGYALLTNNCLTKSLAIFRSYSPALTNAYLPDGKSKAPNYYFTTSLNKARGWEKARTY